MIIKLFSVYDKKTSAYGQPFHDIEEASAIRNFGDAVNDGSNPNNMWHKHPEDFSLCYVGSFDQEQGELLTDKVRSLVSASSLFKEVTK